MAYYAGLDHILAEPNNLSPIKSTPPALDPHAQTLTPTSSSTTAPYTSPSRSKAKSELLRNKYLGAFIINQDIPPRSMGTFSKRREWDGKTSFRIFGYAANSGKNSRWLGVTLPITNGGLFEGELPGVLMKDVGASNTLVDWELAVNSEQGTVRLLLAGTDYQLREPVMPTEEDSIDCMVGYQKYSMERLVLASPKKARCSRLKSARAKTKQDLATLSVEIFTEPRFNETLIPRRRVNVDAPPCANMCSPPTVCIDAGDYKSVVSPQTIIKDVKVRNPLGEMVNGSP
ncbi:hypothetical protein FRB98_004658 [Tulasnella sp. 332]|nr:hypothetical protein FRB98_004658 [Tulasnella sp. 332]